MASLNKIAPCLWFDGEAEQAARHYVSIFEDSAIEAITRFGQEGFEIHGRPPGSVMTVAFRLGRQYFTALNGGPQFKFSEAISFQIHCDTQAEVDHFWNRLSDGGEEGPCGWLKDRYGLSWQVVPSILPEMLLASDPVRTERVTKAYLQMKKFDIATLQRAFDGELSPGPP